tara:strand:+ start:360 stop:707 length:348 start_codon:yes stop_codon:yes gene_type:complete
MSKSSNKKRSDKVRRKLKLVNINRLRLSVYRSSKNISAQIIDDKNHKTLVSASSREKKVVEESKKGELSSSIASLLAKRALEKKISKVYFDRGKYRYHGRIKKFAEALRKNGIIF